MEIVTEVELKENTHNAQRAIKAIEQGAKHDPDGGNGERLTRTASEVLITKIQVAETYGPPRVTEMVGRMALTAGLALDIITNDQDGRAWDFNRLEMRNRAIRRVLQDEPMLFMGGGGKRAQHFAS